MCFSMQSKKKKKVKEKKHKLKLFKEQPGKNKMNVMLH